ncbi:MAG: His-Xaa-Ser system radical SAM maturase HxsB [Alphaproteobacteria bacterium]|nr:His-Xaa-Ser system radical SAM maturase HxsB [Alphaproteobacteria bacterium]
MTRTLTLTAPPEQVEHLGFFRFGDVGGKVVITNDAGEWTLLERPDFQALLVDTLAPEHPKRAELVDKGFLRDGADLNQIAERVARKRRFLGQGPHLHIVITTLRCNQSCKYCHASRTDMDRVDTDMSMETAKKVVDMAMQTTSPYVNFEYQGGEPTVRFDVIQFVVDYSREKNRYEGKTLEHALVTNLTYMTEDKAEWLLANDVLLCTSLDGPAVVHNFNRTWRKGGEAFDRVLHWIRYFNRRYVEMGRDPELWHVDALMTTTRKTLEHWREVIDLYVELGIRNIHLRPLNPFGFANKTWRAIGYTPQEYLDFYARALDYVLELNKQGVQIIEGTASTFLKKMLTPDDPNFVDLRNPVGSGTGQIAYNFDGNIYPSDEGRMIAATGDQLFKLGDVFTSTYDEVVNHPTVKALAVASSLDSLPSCHTCWNAPFCGVRPLHNYMQSGDLFGQRPNTPKCTEHLTIARLLMSKLANDPDVEPIFRRWTIHRPRHESS